MKLYRPSVCSNIQYTNYIGGERGGANIPEVVIVVVVVEVVEC